MRRALILTTLLFAALSARAQAPHEAWRTVESAHFRVHYPRDYEEWARRAASSLESVRAAVVKETGYELPDRVDVIVANPVADANGLAWPIVGGPRIVLYTEAPGPERTIGAYNNWIDLLTVHEVTHIVHLMRPSRSPFRRFAGRWLIPVGPIPLAAPRWVSEGYATVVEGRLTGSGRPPSTMRAVILREWAASGRLPSYSQLDSDSRFLGMSMAYLAGSAFLEWLEQRSGPESLRSLWRRMSARQTRTFDESFAGVFGEKPERLYGEFVAELTASAIAVKRATPRQEGELWQETERSAGDPAVSPDGSKIVVVLRPRNQPADIVVWPTEESEADRKKFEERIAKMLERDPEDVPPVRSKPLPRKPLHTFRALSGDFETPRWMSDGSILYSHRQPDRDGVLHHDLFIWNPATGANRRVTELADVHDADPFPDGRTAIAVRSRYGLTQLVSVDLASGDVTPRSEPSLDVTYSHPRVHRDGTRIAHLEHRNGTWKLVVPGCGDSGEANVSSPEWQGDEIVATLSLRGAAEIHRLRDCAWQPLTRSTGGAFSPAPTAGGAIFFMALEPDGFVVRRIESPFVATLPAYDASLVPALPPQPPSPPAFAAESLPAARDYGLGQQEAMLIGGLALGAEQKSEEIGVRIGDLIGRLDTLVLASFGSRDAQRGGSIAAAWRGWPVELSAHLFHAEDRRVEREGLEMRAARRLVFPRGTVTVEGGALLGRPLDLGFLETTLRLRQRFGAWGVSERFDAAVDGGDGDHHRGALTASLRRGSFGAELRYQRDGGSIDVGGMPSSIVPRSAFARRIFDPALPSESLAGDGYEGLRAELATPILPLALFWQEHRTGDTSLALTGLEWSSAGGPFPLLRIPAFDVTLGAARILDEPHRGRTRWWFGLRWRP